ncbi:MAG TPA: trypsin-like peptidase domain-containing protein [Usitatibacter sp.]|jgi:hypothetical protein|nr:trypsin-like peptidase domain-containing protein [Usitatibacter sp.]
MNRLLISLLLFVSLLSTAALATAQGMPSREAPARAPVTAAFRAPNIPATPVVALPAPARKSAPAPAPNGPLAVGFTRDLAKAAPLEAWTRVRDGYVLRFSASSTGAQGLRARLDVGAMPGPFEVRAQGSDARVETMSVDPVSGPQAWTPWTGGDTQVIEVFSPWLPPAGALRLGSVLHFTASPLAKAAGTCTLSTACAAADATLTSAQSDAIGEVKKAVMRIQFVDNGSAFICTATLVNTEKYPAPYVLTANHCINNAQAAASIAAWWFYDAAACDDPSTPGRIQQAGGMKLVFANYNVDETLLQSNAAPPEGAVYAGWNPAHLTQGTPIVSVSHPKGDTGRYAIGTTVGEFRILGRPQDQYGVRFSEGIIEGGSSGSGLFTLSDGSLLLRGVLTGTTVNQGEGMSCTDLNEDALYSRLEIFYPEIAPYVTNAGVSPDDAPNRVQDFASIPLDLNGADKPLDQASGTVAIDNRRIDYAGDVDVYRFTLSTSSWVSAWTEGPNGANLDTVGSILDSRGVNLIANDDANVTSNHAGATIQLQPGTYYFQVTHWDPAATGAYNVRLRADRLDDNYTDLWWNPAESGWGINFNHQDNTLFATLFTYDANGAPMWLVMSNGARLGAGSYQGTLYRTTGAAFNATPFTGASAASVGTMRVDFTDHTHGALTYTVNGTQVTKAITRQVFSTAPTCTWSAFDRGFSDNVQDLWWNPSESGWGINLTQQGSIVFATLFTYDASGQGLWLVMSNGAQDSAGNFSGTLYRTTGPAFDASPWTAANAQAVGTMSLAFTDGDDGTLTYTYNGITVTKKITRQVFGQMRTDCGSQDQ